MDSGEKAISEEYASSLEDLTFNSKPLINVLTMLAEENSQFASNITELIANRIYKVSQQTKMPSLYLLDSIVKNVGGEYLHLVAGVMEKTFTSVFEKADEKVRRDLYKLRHTWSPYFPTKMLYDLDVAVNKLDPGWPIPSAPPPSPSIHINPKFLKKAENSSGVASLTADISTPQEHQVFVDHQHRLTELERLQEEQLKLTEQEITEHQMKRDLLLKKQQQERHLLLQQQQQQILHLRLQPGDEEELSNGPPSAAVHLPVSTKAETTKSAQETSVSRDPRLRRIEQQPSAKQEPQRRKGTPPAVVSESKPFVQRERELVEKQGSLPVGIGLEHSHNLLGKPQFVQTSEAPPALRRTELNHSGLESKPRKNPSVRRLQHMVRVDDSLIDSGSRLEPRIHRDGSPFREVTGSPQYDKGSGTQKPQHNRRRRNSGDWPSHSPPHKNAPEVTEELPKTGAGRRKPGRGRRRRRSAEGQKDKEKSDQGRGRNPEARKRSREPGNDRFQHEPRVARRTGKPEPMDEGRPPFREEWKHERDFQRRNDGAPGEKWRRDTREFARGNEKMGPGPVGPGAAERLPLRDRVEMKSNSPVPFDPRFVINQGDDGPMQVRDDFVRAGSPGMLEPIFRGVGPNRERTENLGEFEPRFGGPEIRPEMRPEMRPDPDILMREEGHRQFEPMPFGPREPDRPMLPFHDDLRDKPHSDEPLSKKPRPLLTDVEINALRGRNGGSPNRGGRMTPPPMLQEGFRNHPLERPLQEPMEIHPQLILDPHPPHVEHPFPLHNEGPRHRGPPERNFHRDFGPPHMPGDFRPCTPPMEQLHKEWSPGFEIPRELMLDRQSEIMRQAESRLQAGDLTAEQHHDLVDKLQQLYDLQRHPEQTMFLEGGVPPPHLEHRPGHMMIRPGMEDLPLRQGGLINIDGPPLGHGRPMAPRLEGPPEPVMISLGGPGPMELRGPMMGPDGPSFEAGLPSIRLHGPNEGFRGPPMEQDRPMMRHQAPMEGPLIRLERPFEGDQRMEGSPNPQFVHGGPVDEFHRPPRGHDGTAGSLVVAPSTPPRQNKGQGSPPKTPNTPNSMMEKKAVDDLFRRLMHVGIIKVTPEPGSDSPRHVPSPVPPPPEPQEPRPLPAPVPVLPVPQVVPAKPPHEETTIPLIKLVPEALKRRHVGVIKGLYEGMQCSSCGLRFPGEAATIYREHLDWHFRKNRREKDGKRIAHRQWNFIVKDWLNYEEISDPEERARSSFFDINLGAVDSPDPSTSKDSGENSCPVLSGDSEAEAVCDICCEKFEQFWEETNEEWHYKAAVRVDGKTYHKLCYQDAKENQTQAADDDEEEEEEQGSKDEHMETDELEKSPEKGEKKSEDDLKTKEETKVSVDEQDVKCEKDSQIVEEAKTEESDIIASEETPGKVESVVREDKGSDSVISSTVDNNKDTETKGDE